MGDIVDLFGPKKPPADPPAPENHTTTVRCGKEALLLEKLEQGETLIQLDARRPGTELPKQHQEDPKLILKLSWKYDPGDLKVNGWGVRVTLSFGGTNYGIAVPWAAIYRVGNTIWLDEIPQDQLGTMPVTPAPETTH